MKYKYVSIPLSKLVITTSGVIEPKCNSCKSSDCSHQIEYQDVSVWGVNKKMRCLIGGAIPSMVIECEGFTE